MATKGEITEILDALGHGESRAVDRLFALVYDELHTIAHRRLARQRPGETLNTTVLVHEAYIKLVERANASWENRNHFFAVAAKAMRHITVDYARKRLAQKRGGELQRVVLDEGGLSVSEQAAEIVALDSALSKLSALNERLSRVVELRFFGGLSAEQVGELLNLSSRTVKRDWRKARAFLYNSLKEQDGV